LGGNEQLDRLPDLTKVQAMKRLLLALSLSLAFIATTQPASAGFVIIDWTDANDHGSASGGVNVGG